MADLELLKAIEEMMDRKFDEKLAPVNQRLERIEGRIDGLEKRMDGLEKRMDTMEEELSEVKEGMSEIRIGVNAMLEWADEVSGTIAFPIPKMKL